MKPHGSGVTYATKGPTCVPGISFSVGQSDPLASREAPNPLGEERAHQPSLKKPPPPRNAPLYITVC